MEYRTLGRTGLNVSLVGLGSGGPSRLGQSTDVPETEIYRLVKTALELGVNIIDTATGYGDSEAILGRALRDVPRDRYYIATKASPRQKSSRSAEGDRIIDGSTLVEQVERSLRRLNVGTIDIFQFHGLLPEDYSSVIQHLLPVAQKLREQGKIRFIGVTEMYFSDGEHSMLQQALSDNHFDTIMVGYNLLNQSAEKTVLPECQKKNVGVFVMIAVRRALSRPERLKETIADLKARGRIPKDALPDENPLGWLISENVESIPAAGYKFVAPHPAVSTVLTGTANLDHFHSNVKAILGESLPKAHEQRLREIFGHLEESLGN